MKTSFLQRWNKVTREVSNWDLQISLVHNAIACDGMTTQRRARLKFVTKKYDEAMVKFREMEVQK